MKYNGLLYLSLFLLGASYILLFIGFWNYFSGFHDIDLAVNYELLSKEFDIPLDEIQETTTKGDILTVQELYLRGIRQQSYSIPFFIGSGMLFMAGLYTIVRAMATRK